jgi:hypothetical protein
MKLMKLLLFSTLVVVLLFALPDYGFCQNPIKARTDTGKEVLLYPDGKWKYAEEKKDISSETKTHNKSASSTTPLKSTKGAFEIWFDEAKWSAPKTDEGGRIHLKLKSGDAYVLIVSEEIGVPTASLKDLALENAKSVGSDFSLLAEETRMVNARELTSLKFNTTIKGILLTYYGYYYGGKEGAIQVICFTGQNLFGKYERDFTELLDGFVIP